MIIDANIFLELLLKQEKSDKCKIFLNKTVNGEINAALSDFSIDSIIISLARNKIDIDIIKQFLQKLVRSKGIRVYSVNLKDRLNALVFMEKYNLDYEDALILQSAVSTGSEEIVSFDKHFDKINEVKRIEP